MSTPLLPPSQAEANESSQAASDLAVSTANTAFIQAIIALIDTATPLGLYQVQPPIPTNADYNAISAYFTALGYTVSISFPPSPFFGFDNGCIPAGFSQALGNNFQFWGPSSPPPAYPSPQWASWQVYVQRHHPRMTLSWAFGTAVVESFLLLETGDLFLLENGIDGILLESSP